MYACSGIPTPELNISEEYLTDNITVTVEWAQQAGVRYYANVVPYVPIASTKNGSYQLTISYNTKYNFSVVAAALCRPNATMFITLNYGEIHCSTLVHAAIIMRIPYSCDIMLQQIVDILSLMIQTIDILSPKLWTMMIYR